MVEHLQGESEDKHIRATAAATDRTGEKMDTLRKPLTWENCSIRLNYFDNFQLNTSIIHLLKRTFTPFTKTSE